MDDECGVTQDESRVQQVRALRVCQRGEGRARLHLRLRHHHEGRAAAAAAALVVQRREGRERGPERRGGERPVADAAKQRDDLPGMHQRAHAVRLLVRRRVRRLARGVLRFQQAARGEVEGWGGARGPRGGPVRR